MLKLTTAADKLATAKSVHMQPFMDWQHAHADRALLPRGQFPKRANIHLVAEIELPPSFLKFLLDGPAFMFMLLTMFVLTLLVAIPNALAGCTLLE